MGHIGSVSRCSSTSGNDIHYQYCVIIIIIIMSKSATKLTDFLTFKTIATYTRVLTECTDDPRHEVIVLINDLSLL